MAKQFLTSIDLNANEVQNAKFHILPSDPTGGDLVEALFWFNSSDNVFRYYDGTDTHSIFELTAADVLAMLLTVDGAGSGLDADLLDGEQGSHYLSRANHSGEQAQSTVTGLIAALAAKLDASEKGAANGVAELDANGKVPLTQLPDDVLGQLDYQGTWNASTNSPAIVSSTGTKGHYYVVSTAGATNIDGESDWGIGDWIVFNGSEWQKLDNSDRVTSVNGQQGVVQLDAEDVPFSNGGTGLSATDVQAALVEIHNATGAGLGKFVDAIGNGSATQVDVTHNLGSRDVTVAVRQTASPYAEVECDVSFLSTTAVRLNFAVAPATDEYTVTVIG